jgi:hypothetical protein
VSRPEIEATIVAELPKHLYLLETEDHARIIAGPSPETRRVGGHYKPGQTVRVRVTAADPSRGIILGALRQP